MVTKDREVLKSERLLEVYESSAQSHRRQMKEDLDFKNGAQWTKEQERELRRMKQVPITVNVISPIVDQAVALLTTNKPRFTSTGREDSDTATGRLFSDLLTYIWDISAGNTELKTAVEDYYSRSIGWMIAYQDFTADFGKGEVFLKALDPFDVYVDPNCKDRLGRDAAHIIVARIQTREQLLVNYPHYKDLLKDAQKAEYVRMPEGLRIGFEGQTDYDGFLDKEHDHFEVIDRYSKIKSPVIKLTDQAGNERILSELQFMKFLQQPAFIARSSREERLITSPQEIQEMMRLYQSTGGVFHLEFDETGSQAIAAGPENGNMSVPGSTVELILTDMEYLIKAGAFEQETIYETRIKRVLSAGGVKLYDDIMDISEYPLVPIMNNHNRNPYPISDVRKARGLQEYINKIRSLIIAHASSSTNVKLLIPRGSANKKDIEAQWARAGTAVIEFDPEIGTPVIAGPVPLPNELYKNEADAKADIEFIFGIWQMQMGNAEMAPNTFKGTVALDEYGQRRIKGKKDDIESSLNQLAKVTVQLIQQTYTEAKVIRLLRPNNEPKEILINQPIYDDTTEKIIGRMNDITIGRYDVVVLSGSMLPSNRYARYEYYERLYQLGVIDQLELLKQTELVDIEGVLNRFNLIEKLQQQVSYLEEELKKTKGDLQTSERESVHAKKQAEVAKFKSELKGIQSEAEASSQIYSSRLNDMVSLQDERLRNERKLSVKQNKEG